MKTWSPIASLLAVSIALAGCTAESGPSKTETPGSVELPEQEVLPPETAPGDAPETQEKPGEPAATPPVERFSLPAWEREDIQPKSPGFGKTYGLEALRGKTVVVILLDGYCPFCRSNSLVAEQLQEELAAEKLDVQVVVLSDANASDFVGRVSLPIFRDADKSAWNEMRTGAAKHDTFVFAPSGKRTYFWLGSYQGDPARWRTEVGAAARQVAQPVKP